MVGRSVGRIHTHLRNAVPLVWGSLRLAPTKHKCVHNFVPNLCAITGWGRSGGVVTVAGGRMGCVSRGGVEVDG